jgi:hypothetical protein
MCSPADVGDALDYLRDIYGRSDAWPGRVLRGAWEDAFADVPEAAMMAAIKAAMVESPKFPPTPMTVAALVEVQSGGPAQGPSGPRACPDCWAVPGFREMAIQWVTPAGKHEARVVVAACECRLGEMRKAGGATAWRDLWDAWRGIRDRLVADGGRVVGGPWRTHRDHPRLTDEQRFTPEDLSRWPRKSHAAAVAGVFAALNGRDEHAYQRARSLERDERRDEWEGEEAS